MTYNLIVEGMLAETGYHAYHEALTRNGILPGMQKASVLLKQDESRHLAYGVHLLSRLVREHGDPVWNAIEARMEELLGPATGIITEAFADYDPENMPFGLSPEIFIDFAEVQFRKRIEHVRRARG